MAQESVATLESEKSELQRQCQESLAKLAQVESEQVSSAQLEAVELELSKLKRDNEEKRSASDKQLADLQKQLAEKDDSLATQAQELKRAMADGKENAAQVQQLRNTLRQETTQLTSQLTTAKSAVSSLENENSELATEVARLAKEPAPEQAEWIEAQAAELKELERKLAAKEKSELESAELVKSQASQLQGLAAKVESLEQAQRDSVEQTRQLMAARESDGQAIAAARQEAETKTRELNSAQEELKKTSLPDPALQARIDSLESELGSKSNAVAELQQIKSELTSTQIRHAAQLKELMAGQALVEPSSATAGSDESSSESAEDFKAELQAQEKRIMELESENHEAREQLAALAKIRANMERQAEADLAAKRAKPKSSKADRKAGAKQKSSASNVSGSSTKSSSKDDLTRIVGIGKVFQGKLNRNGIKSFEQIAAWTKSDAEAIAEKIGLGERVSNENWVKQAKALAKEKKK